MGSKLTTAIAAATSAGGSSVPRPPARFSTAESIGNGMGGCWRIFRAVGGSALGYTGAWSGAGYTPNALAKTPIARSVTSGTATPLLATPRNYCATAIQELRPIKGGAGFTRCLVTTNRTHPLK